MRPRHILSLAAMTLASSLAATAPAVAQERPEWEKERERMTAPHLQTGTRFLREPETADAAQARGMQKEIASCMYRKKRADSDTLLANSDFFTIDFDASGIDREDGLDDLGLGDCMKRVMKHGTYQMYMSYQFSTMRNLLAEEAYLRGAGKAVRLADGAGETVAGRRLLAGAQSAVIGGVADCLVFRNLEASDALLRAAPASREEAAALDRLLPTFATCMKSDKADVTLGTSMVRQLVADGLWTRLSAGELLAG